MKQTSCYSYLADAGPYARVSVHTAAQRAAAGHALGVPSVTQGTSVAALSGVASLAMTETRQQTWGKREKTRDLFDLSLSLSGTCVPARKATPLGDVTEGSISTYLTSPERRVLAGRGQHVRIRPVYRDLNSEFPEIPVTDTF